MSEQKSVRDDFERTTCACDKCKVPCRHMPGCLVPGDLEAIKTYLHVKDEECIDWLCENFRASSGAKVLRMIKGTPEPELLEVPTIVPAQKPDGSCVFLADNGQCKIHPVSPFGCAYHDMHMNIEEAGERSDACVRSQMDALEERNGINLYKDAIELLRSKGRLAPPIEERRANLEEDLALVENDM